MGFHIMKVRSLLLAGAVLPLVFAPASALMTPQPAPESGVVILVQNAAAAQVRVAAAQQAVQQARRRLRQAERGGDDVAAARADLERAEKELGQARQALAQARGA